MGGTTGVFSTVKSAAEPSMKSLPAPSTTIRRLLAGAPPALFTLGGIGHYLPERLVTNADIAPRLGIDSDWIIERTGIRSRRWASPGQATSDLALLAARAALADAGLTVADIDLLILSTNTPDYQVPTTSCILQAELGCHGIPAMDVAAGCAGFGYALHSAGALVRSGFHRRVLVVGADCMHTVTNLDDRHTGMIFGDGAGAAVVGGEGPMSVIYSDLGAEGRDAHMIVIPAGGSRKPATAESVAAGEHTVHMKGREVFRGAVRQMCDCLRRAADHLRIGLADFDLIVPHQANARIIDAVAAEFGLGRDRVVCDVEETGNISAGSIPVALSRARDAGRVRSGMLIATVAFGAGMTWSCQVILVQ